MPSLPFGCRPSIIVAGSTRHINTMNIANFQLNALRSLTSTTCLL